MTQLKTELRLQVAEAETAGSETATVEAEAEDGPEADITEAEDENPVMLKQLRLYLKLKWLRLMLELK